MCRNADVKRFHIEGTKQRGQGETRVRKIKESHFIKIYL